MNRYVEDLRQGPLAKGIYLAATYGSAWILALSGKLQTILAHRSVGTGEIYFGRSDIDLALVLAPDMEGKDLERLYQFCRLLRALNPASGHINVHHPGGIEACAALDTMWASMERQSFRHLWGEPLSLEVSAVKPIDALRQFLVWIDVFFPAAVQRRDARNCLKHALECWNFYAVAQGLLPQPFATRRQMREHLEACQSLPADLDTPSGTARFILGLANMLHQTRMSALPKLREPLIFEATAAPHGFKRTYVILPTPEAPLPKEAFFPGSFLATPELLDLYLQFKNGFFSWLTPPELKLKPPTVCGFLRDLRHYCNPYFLHFPGFTETNTTSIDPRAKFTYLSHAFDWLCRDKLPPPVTVLEPHVLLNDVSAYYRLGYDALRQQNDALLTRISKLLGS
jgi:hypothetical protein